MVQWVKALAEWAQGPEFESPEPFQKGQKCSLSNGIISMKLREVETKECPEAYKAAILSAIV